MPEGDGLEVLPTELLIEPPTENVADKEALMDKAIVEEDSRWNRRDRARSWQDIQRTLPSRINNSYRRQAADASKRRFERHMGHHLKRNECLLEEKRVSTGGGWAKRREIPEKRRSMKSLSYWLWWANKDELCEEQTRRRDGEIAHEKESQWRHPVCHKVKGRVEPLFTLSHPKKKWRPNGSHRRQTGRANRVPNVGCASSVFSSSDSSLQIQSNIRINNLLSRPWQHWNKCSQKEHSQHVWMVSK